MIDCLKCKNFNGCTVRIIGQVPQNCYAFKDIDEDRTACDEITISPSSTDKILFDKNTLAIPSNFTHDQLIIECDKIILRENGQEVEFEFENNKINNINVIVINGIKFERIKKYE